ncbi:MAG TPA: hypothetical protein VM406_11220, partial [Noviherbaspirillum sp.]|nr:hypothetical protein [Noviherbaspirillum sp.]
MTASTVFDHSPWVGRYKNIDWQLKTPPAASLPAMVSAASRAYAKQKAFTCVMPNGMYGTLTYEQTDRMSDDFAVYLREVLKLA